MASKKKNVDQVDLFGGGKSLFPKIEVRPDPTMPKDAFALVGKGIVAGALVGAGAIVSDAALAPTERAPAIEPEPEPRPKLRLVPPQPDEDVTIEPDDSGFFWVSFVRHDGTTRGAVRITKRQVEMLLARAPIALEMSK